VRVCERKEHSEYVRRKEHSGVFIPCFPLLDAAESENGMGSNKTCLPLVAAAERVAGERGGGKAGSDPLSVSAAH